MPSEMYTESCSRSDCKLRTLSRKVCNRQKKYLAYICALTWSIYQSMLQRAYGFSGNIKNNLKCIPVHLLINNIRYVLSGVVQFIEFNVQKELGHYIAYCRLVNNNWEKRDDMRKKQRIWDKIYQI